MAPSTQKGLLDACHGCSGFSRENFELRNPWCRHRGDGETHRAKDSRAGSREGRGIVDFRSRCDQAVEEASSRVLVGGEELFIVPSGERRVLYAPLRGAILEINEAAARALVSDAEGARSSPWFEPSWQTILRQPKAEVSRDRGADQPFEPYAVGLCLTDRCNLACTYCHADASAVGATRLSTRAAEAAIDFAFANAVKHEKCLEVTFPGPGEPTQAMDLLRGIVEHVERIAEHHPQGHRISMSTNGIYGSRVAEYITDHFTAVSLSFDGPKAIHDAQRPARDGGGSFERVLETARFLFRKRFLFSIRATVTELGVDRLREIWDFFQTEFPGIPVGLERMNPLGRGETSRLRPPAPTAFDAAFEELLRTVGGTEGLLLNSGVGKLNQVRGVFCKSLGYPCMTVRPEGNVTACQRDGAPDFFYYGRWNDERAAFEFDESRIGFFRTLGVESYPECVGCFAKYHCAGDCQDLRLHGIRRCSTNRRMLVVDLLNKIDHDRSITSVTQDDPRFRSLSRRLHHP